ncbi:cupredoxin domain-containing protein [Niallia sp. 01092]|uniref:cupredoxin domain-containing protein n=1 Tax=unclassified Niallia TaxID=2837522 RepID=UPI003FD100E4
MKTRKNLLFLSLIALIFILSACGGSQQGADNTDNNTNQENMEGMDHTNMDDSTTSDSNSSSNASSGEEVSIVASNWKWDLSKTTFKVGEPVTFSIEGQDSSHGFTIEGTNIKEQIAPGETKKVTWTPEKAGEYTIKCTVFCGDGHDDMVQKITVN